MQRSEDASPRDGGQGHRGHGTTRLFPERGRARVAPGEAGRAHSCGIERSERRGSGTATAPNRECTLSAKATAPQAQPYLEMRQDTGDAPAQPSALSSGPHFRFPSRDRPARTGAGPARPGGDGSATRRRLRARGGAGSAPVASETALCFRGRGHDSLGFRRRTRWCCGRRGCGTLGWGPTPQFCMSALRGWGELPGDGRLDLSPGPGGAGPERVDFQAWRSVRLAICPIGRRPALPSWG